MTDRKEILRRLLPCVIKPLVTADWWQKTLTLFEQMTGEVPFYLLNFDKSGKVVDELAQLIEVDC
jgi:hypothetical protein